MNAFSLYLDKLKNGKSADKDKSDKKKNKTYKLTLIKGVGCRGIYRVTSSNKGDRYIALSGTQAHRAKLYEGDSLEEAIAIRKAHDANHEALMKEHSASPLMYRKDRVYFGR